jgi:hypothetical protein
MTLELESKAMYPGANVIVVVLVVVVEYTVEVMVVVVVAVFTPRNAEQKEVPLLISNALITEVTLATVQKPCC